MILLLGGTGYLNGCVPAFFNCEGVDFIAFSRAEQGYTQPDVLEAWMKEKKPSFLINAAGYTGKPNVDACEVDKANCLFGNPVLSGFLEAFAPSLACRGGMSPVLKKGYPLNVSLTYECTLDIWIHKSLKLRNYLGSFLQVIGSRVKDDEEKQKKTGLVTPGRWM